MKTINESGTLQFSKESLADQLVKSDATQSLLNKYSLALKHLSNFCQSFEGRFDNDASVISYEELNEYLEATEFLKSIGVNFSRLQEVKDEMNSRTI